MFRLKQNEKGEVAPINTVETDDFHYDLFDGGYIKPENQLDEESAMKVREAIFIIKAYEKFLKVNDLLNEY